MIFRLLVPALLLAACVETSGAHAQGTGPCAAPAAADSAARKPDLVIRATARAEEVRFRSEPEVQVRLTGCTDRNTSRVLERRNLPEPVRSGVIYRDVFIAVEILGYLDVECLLPETGPVPRRAAPDPGPGLSRLCPPGDGEAIATPQPRR
jgi:hypothetical protein